MKPERIVIPVGDRSDDDPQRPPRGVTVSIYEERATGRMHLACYERNVWTRERTIGRRDWEPWQKFEEDAN